MKGCRGEGLSGALHAPTHGLTGRPWMVGGTKTCQLKSVMRQVQRGLAGATQAKGPTGTGFSGHGISGPSKCSGEIGWQPSPIHFNDTCKSTPS